MIENESDKHYYYTDQYDNEWQFTEINGTLNKYYFKCSTTKCKGFGMINRNNKKKEFILSKEHNIEYFNHSYFKNKKCMKKLLNNKINKEEWECDNIRYALFKYYFSQNLEATEEECKLYFKQYLKELFIVNKKIDEEIKKSKISSIYTNKSYSTIYDKIIHLKDLNNDEICYLSEYEHYNKFKKKDEKLKMFFIMNKNMCLEIKNKDIYQFFGDATYRCTPPTFRGYKFILYRDLI